MESIDSYVQRKNKQMEVVRNSVKELKVTTSILDICVPEALLRNCLLMSSSKGFTVVYFLGFRPCQKRRWWNLLKQRLVYAFCVREHMAIFGILLNFFKMYVRPVLFVRAGPVGFVWIRLTWRISKLWYCFPLEAACWPSITLQSWNAGKETSPRKTQAHSAVSQ